jgi:hypothetical protein
VRSPATPTDSEHEAAMATSVYDSLAYIRRYYGVPAVIPGRVRYTWRGERFGTIVGTSGAYLMILLDGDRRPSAFHPTWELEYVELADPSVGAA